jgi:hypothetical protein
MSTITTNPLRDQRARIAADAVVSAYIHELGSSRPRPPRSSLAPSHRDADRRAGARGRRAPTTRRGCSPSRLLPVG